MPKMLNVRLSDEDWDQLAADVEASGMARSAYVRQRLFASARAQPRAPARAPGLVVARPREVTPRPKSTWQ